MVVVVVVHSAVLRIRCLQVSSATTSIEVKPGHSIPGKGMGNGCGVERENKDRSVGVGVGKVYGIGRESCSGVSATAGVSELALGSVKCMCIHAYQLSE